MKWISLIRELHPRQPFRIARARRTAVRNVFLRIEAEGVVGHGEASPNSFYDETAEGVCAKLELAGEFIESLSIGSVLDIERAWENAWPILAPSRAAQCALDLALWDWLGRRLGVTTTELAWNKPPRPVPTFCTIGLSSAEELEEKVADLKGFPLIKIKSDAAADLHPIRYVREQSDAVLAVDANCAWQEHDLAHLATQLAELSVAFIEQPNPPSADLPRIQPHVVLPVFADESCVVESDVERIRGDFQGINIKLVKCGGITPAVRMVKMAHTLGLKTMVGCMLESSALIAAGAAIAQETDYADLDGAWLIGDDPMLGWLFEDGVLLPSGMPGLGIQPCTEMFPRK